MADDFESRIAKYHEERKEHDLAMQNAQAHQNRSNECAGSAQIQDNGPTGDQDAEEESDNDGDAEEESDNDGDAEVESDNDGDAAEDKGDESGADRSGQVPGVAN
jgi:hypothetical protein